MNLTRAWITYLIVRLAAFIIPFAAVLLALPDWQWNWLAGAIVGAIISFAVSVIFLREERLAIGQSVEDRRAAAGRRDRRAALDHEEDADLDAAHAGATADTETAAEAAEPTDTAADARADADAAADESTTK